MAGPILMVMGEALHPAIGWATLSAVGFLLTMYAIYLTIHRIRRPRGEGGYYARLIDNSYADERDRRINERAYALGGKALSLVALPLLILTWWPSLPIGAIYLHTVTVILAIMIGSRIYYGKKM